MRARVLVVCALLAGCTQLSELVQPRAASTLESTSLEPGVTGLGGTIDLGTAFVLLDARIGAAPHDAPGRAATLGGAGATALARDHWLLIVRLRESAPGSGAGAHVVSLEWNGQAHGAIALDGPPGASARDVELAFDVGSSLESSNVYVLTARADPR